MRWKLATPFWHLMGKVFEIKGIKSKFTILSSLSLFTLSWYLASSLPLISGMPIHVSYGAFVIRPDPSHLPWCARFMPQWKKCFGVQYRDTRFFIRCCRSVWHSLLSTALLQLDFQFHIREEWNISSVLPSVSTPKTQRGFWLDLYFFLIILKFVFLRYSGLFFWCSLLY